MEKAARRAGVGSTMKKKKSLKRKLFTLVAYAAAAFALLWTAGIYALSQMDAPSRAVKEIETLVSNALKTPLVIGKVRINYFGQVVIDEARLGSEEAPMVSIEKITASLSLTRFLKDRGSPANIVRKVSLESPRIFIRRLDDGSFNFDALISGGGGGAEAAMPDFPIIIRNGFLEFSDAFDKAPLPVREAVLRDFEGSVELRGERVIAIKILSSDASLADKLEAAFELDLRAGWRLDSKLNGVPLALVAEIAGLKGAEVGGKADALAFRATSTYTTIGHPPRYSWGGEIEVSDAWLTTADGAHEITDIRGRATYSETAAAIELVEFSMHGGEFRATGAALLSGNPEFNGRASFRGVSLGMAAAALSVPPGHVPAGRADGFAYLKLGGGAPAVSAWVAASGIEYRGLSFDSVEGQLAYDGERAEYGFSAGGPSGSLEARGTAVADQGGAPAVNAAVEFSGFELAEALAAAEIDPGVPANGLLEGELFIGGRISAKRLPDAFGAARASGMRIADATGVSATLSFRHSAGVFTIENLVAEAEDELLIADGTIGVDGSLDISVDAAVARVTTALALARREDIPGAGAIKLSGAIGGSLSSPTFRGSVEGRDIMVSDMAADRVTGGVAYSANVVRLSDLKIHTGKNVQVVDGSLDLARRLANLEVRMRDASIAGLAGLAVDTFRSDFEPPADLDGFIDVDAVVSGSFDYPVISVKISARDVVAYGEKIDRAAIWMEYDRFLRIVDGSSVSAFGGETKVSGLLDPDAIDLMFEASGLQAEKISRGKAFGVFGKIKGFCSVTGSFRSPLARMSFSSAGLDILGSRFKLENAGVELRQSSRVTIDGVELSRGSERYRIDATYDAATGGLDMTATLAGAELRTLADMFEGAARLEAYSGGSAATVRIDLPGGMSGAINGSVRVFSAADGLAGAVDLSGEGLTLGAYPIDKMEFYGGFIGKSIEIQKFEAQNELALVEANGKLNLERAEASLLKVSATGIELKRLSDSGVVSIPVGGMLDLDIDIVSESGRQKMEGSLYVSEPSALGVKMDRMRGQFEFDGKALSLKNLQAQRGSDLLAIFAVLPVSKDYGEMFSMSLDSDGMDLSPLNPLLGGDIKVTGRAAVENVRVSGGLENPSFSGTVRLLNAGLSASVLKPALSAVNGSLVFSKDALRSQDLRGMMGDHAVTAALRANFKGVSVESAALEIGDIENLNVEYSNIYKGRATLTGIALKYSPGRLDIGGREGATPTLKAHNGSFMIPSFSAGGAAAKPALAVHFGPQPLNIVVGDGFQVQSAWRNMRLTPTGRVQVSGSIDNPQLKGWLTATRGHVGFYTTTFRTTETIIGFNTIEGVGVVPIFYTEAVANAQGTEITMRVSGPMVDISLYPAYQELCGTAGGDAGVGAADAIGAQTIAMGDAGDIIVPVCPRARFEAYEDNDVAGRPLTEEQILMKLGMVDALAGDRSAADALETLAVGAVSPFVGSVIERGINLENFTINLDPNKDVLVKLEKRLMGNLSLRYERLFSKDEKELLELRYEFRKRSFLKWGIDQDSETDYQVEYRLRF
jgi:hypothetical protein